MGTPLLHSLKQGAYLAILGYTLLVLVALAANTQGLAS